MSQIHSKRIRLSTTALFALVLVATAAPLASAQNACPSGVVGTPDNICVRVIDQITGAVYMESGTDSQAISTTLGDYAISLVATGINTPAGASISLAGDVTRLAFTAQPPLQGLVVEVDYGQVGPINEIETELSLTGSAVGTTLTRVEGEIGYPTPLVDVLNFLSVGNIAIEAPTTGAGSFFVTSGPIPVNSGGVALRLVTQFIPNAIGDVITIPADISYGEPITPGDDPGIVTEINGAHYSLDELLVREADDFCPLPYFRDDPLAPVFSLEGEAVPNYGPCGAGTFEEMRIQRSSFLSDALFVEAPIVIPARTAWVIEESSTVTIVEGGSVSVEEGGAIVLLGELINQGELFLAPDSTMSLVGRFENQGFVENGGGFYNDTTIENEGRIEFCEAGFETGSGEIGGSAPIPTSNCVPEPGFGGGLLAGLLLLAELVRRARA